jgi:hypothetical protein
LKRKTCGGAEKNNGRAGAVCCAVSKWKTNCVRHFWWHTHTNLEDQLIFHEQVDCQSCCHCTEREDWCCPKSDACVSLCADLSLCVCEQGKFTHSHAATLWAVCGVWTNRCCRKSTRVLSEKKIGRPLPSSGRLINGENCHLCWLETKASNDVE